MVFLEVLGRWSMIPELHPDWSRGEGGRPVREGGRPVREGGRLVPGPVMSPVRSHGFWTLLDGR